MDANNSNFQKSGSVADLRQHVSRLQDLRSATAARIAVLMKAKKLKVHERHFIMLLE